MNPLYTPLIALGSTYLLWFFYLAIMNLKRASEAGLLSKQAAVLGAPFILMGTLLDVLVNVFVMTFVLLELPQERMVTARLKRHIAAKSGWRFKVASWFIPLLDPFDPSGRHITEATEATP